MDGEFGSLVSKEIFEGLGFSEEKIYSPNPTLFCSLGEFGWACLHKLQEMVVREKGSQAWIHFLAVQNKQSKRFYIKKQKSAQLWTLLLRGSFSSPVELSQVFQSQSSLLKNFISQLVADLLESAGKKQLIQTNRVHVYIVADWHELLGSVGSLELARFIKSSLKGFLADFTVEITGIFLLPKGKSEKGALVYATLKDLEKIQERWPLYDHCFFLSSVNPHSPLVLSEVEDLVADFLFLSLFSEIKPVLDEILEGAEPPFATFGLAGLTYPAEALINEEASRFALEMIEREFLGFPRGDAKRESQEFLKVENINLEGLYWSLVNLEGLSILEEIKVDPLIFQEVEMKFWPDRIASYDAFLANEKTKKQIEKVRQNLINIATNLKVNLQKKVDDLLSSNPSLEEAHSFLENLLEILSELKTKALRRKEEILRTIPSLAEKNANLGHQIQNLPSMEAILSRWAIGGLVAFYFTLRALKLLRQVPPKYFHPGYIPPTTPTLLFLVFAVLLGVWLTFKRAEAKLFRARQDYLESVEKRHRYMVDYWVHRALVWLLGGESADLSLQNVSNLKEVIEDELKKLENLRKIYLQTVQTLKEEKPSFFSFSKVRRNLFSFVEKPFDLRYKKGRYSLSQEALLFLNSGVHHDWRGLDKDELLTQIKNFSRQGLLFAHSLSIKNFLKQVGAEGLNLSIIFESLRKASQPYLALVPKTPRISRLVAIEDPSDSPLEGATAVYNSDHQTFWYFQLGYPVAISNIASLPLWYQAYQEVSNKDSLHCLLSEEEKLAEA